MYYGVLDASILRVDNSFWITWTEGSRSDYEQSEDCVSYLVSVADSHTQVETIIDPARWHSAVCSVDLTQDDTAVYRISNDQSDIPSGTYIGIDVLNKETHDLSRYRHQADYEGVPQRWSADIHTAMHDGRLLVAYKDAEGHWDFSFDANGPLRLITAFVDELSEPFKPLLAWPSGDFGDPSEPLSTVGYGNGYILATAKHVLWFDPDAPTRIGRSEMANLSWLLLLLLLLGTVPARVRRRDARAPRLAPFRARTTGEA